jgi:hypothetical protein
MIETADDSALFVLEGTVSELHTEISHDNLLRKVLSHYKEQSVVTGVGAAVGDLFGQAANAAMLAMYDGEYTESFVCLIDGQVVCGTFGGASKLREGGRIKAIVSRKGDVLVAHAMLSEEQGYAWVKHPYGSWAERAANLKLALFVWLSSTVFVTGTVFLIDSSAITDEAPLFWLGIVLLWGAICLGMALWANSDMKALAGPSTEIFRLLGFDKPERVNLNSHQYSIVCRDVRLDARERQHQYDNVYCYKKAIEDGKVKMAV